MMGQPFAAIPDEPPVQYTWQAGPGDLNRVSRRLAFATLLRPANLVVLILLVLSLCVVALGAGQWWPVLLALLLFPLCALMFYVAQRRTLADVWAPGAMMSAGYGMNAMTLVSVRGKHCIRYGNFASVQYSHGLVFLRTGGTAQPSLMVPAQLMPPDTFAWLDAVLRSSGRAPAERRWGPATVTPRAVVSGAAASNLPYQWCADAQSASGATRVAVMEVVRRPVATVTFGGILVSVLTAAVLLGRPSIIVGLIVGIGVGISLLFRSLRKAMNRYLSEGMWVSTGFTPDVIHLQDSSGSAVIARSDITGVWERNGFVILRRGRRPFLLLPAAVVPPEERARLGPKGDSVTLGNHARRP